MRVLIFGLMLSFPLYAGPTPAPPPTPRQEMVFTQDVGNPPVVLGTLPIKPNITTQYDEIIDVVHDLERYQVHGGGSFVQGRLSLGITQTPRNVVVCPSQPPPQTRTEQCSVTNPGTTGTWTQTSIWQKANPPVPPNGCWLAGPWLPTSAPPDACTQVQPPPGGDIDLSYVDLSSPAFATYKNWGDSCLPNNNCYQFLPTDAALLGKLSGAPQYCAKAISDADAYAAHVESSIAAGGQPNWTGNSQGMDGLSGDSYLAVGPRLRDLAITLKECPNVTTSQRSRWTAIITQSVYNVWNPALAQWGGRPYPWSGWTVTPPDPGDNYYYSFTLATMMYQWVTGDAQYASHTWPVLSAYFATIPTGGSEEGTGYGTSHKGLFEDIRWQRDIFSENYVDAHLTNSVFYWVHCTLPGGVNFCAIGDQSRTNPPAWTDYQRALIAQAITTTTDVTAKAQGSWLLHHVTPAGMTSTYDYRDGLLSVGNGGTAPTALCYFGQSTGDLFCRTDWTPTALWAGFRAGKYDQSHAHQDQGAIQLFQNGWLVVDQSVWSHSGIQQAVTDNSTLAFYNGSTLSRQVYNSTSTMTVTGMDPATGVHATANLQPAAGAAASAWTRTFDFVGTTITVNDTFALNAGYTAVSQVQVPVQPTVSGNVVTTPHLRLTVLAPASPAITIVSMHSVDPDFNSGYRIEIRGGSSQYKYQLQPQ